MRAEVTLFFVALCAVALPSAPSPRRQVAHRALARGAGRRRVGPDLVAFGGQRRAQRHRREALPLVLELVARELRSGVTISQAFEHVAATADEVLDLDSLVDRLRNGQLIGPAIDWWVARFDPADAALVGGVFHLGTETGTAIADALDRAIAGLRARAELADEILALTAQSRASALLVAVAPLGFGVVLLVAEPDAAAFLFTSGLGFACLVIGLTLDAVGFWWMHRLVERISA